MKIISSNTLTWMAMGLMLFIGTAVAGESAEYRDFSKMTPSGTVEFDTTSLKLIAGASWGSGSLHYQGKSYPIKVKAATAGGIGYRESQGKGNVYELSKLEDFAGNYVGAGAGGTAGDMTGNVGKTVAENGNGVVMHLEVTDSKGLQLSLSAGGLMIEFAE